MIYAKEVIDLLSAYPGREFRPKEIARYAMGGKTLTAKQRHALRVGVWRVLVELVESGTVAVRPPKARRGGIARYSWKSAT